MGDVHICPRCGGDVQSVRLVDQTAATVVDGYECLNCTLLFTDYCETAETVKTPRYVQTRLSCEKRSR